MFTFTVTAQTLYILLSGAASSTHNDLSSTTIFEPSHQNSLPANTHRTSSEFNQPIASTRHYSSKSLMAWRGLPNHTNPQEYAQYQNRSDQINREDERNPAPCHPVGHTLAHTIHTTYSPGPQSTSPSRASSGATAATPTIPRS